MEVFNKFYSSVTSTVSQLSGVLPGNSVTREFEGTQFIATAGPGLLWKIYKGFKKSTRQEAALFLFEKKQLDKWPKADRDNMIDIFKRAIIQLTKLRHPQILTVQHGLEESRDSLAFATEPVFTSLANVLGKTENIPHLVNYSLYDVEIKYGLMNIAEGLAFLHNDVKLLHRNICPESIILNQQGAWKIFGFDFCIASQSTEGRPPFWPFTEYCSAKPSLLQPSLDYLAPEYVLTATHSPASDIYSLGMLIYVLHNTEHETLGNIGTDYSKYKLFAKKIKDLHQTKLLDVKDGLKDYVKLMLNVTPELRPDLHQFLKIPYFEDVGVKALNYLDSLFQWDNIEKSQFYKGLPQILQNMPHRICIYRILPCLSKEFVNPMMVPFVLPNVFLIAQNCTKEEYVKHVLPLLLPIMIIQEPIQILLIFMQNMELMLKLTPPDEVKGDILPMLYRALESDVQQIQELCLCVIPTFVSLIDYTAMKNALLPRIKKLCCNTNYMSVRVNCLLCIGKLLEYMDKWLVADEILQFLPHIPSREPAVVMGVLGIYKIALTSEKLGITNQLLATKVLPFLLTLLVEQGLTLNQFKSIMLLVRQMLGKIEREQRAVLQQLDSAPSPGRILEREMITSGDFQISPSPPMSSAKSSSGINFDPFGNNNFSQESLDQSSSVGTATSSAGGIFAPFGNHNSSQGSHDHSSPLANASVTLSIEDKQRIASQQEAARKLSQNRQQSAAKSPSLYSLQTTPVSLPTRSLSVDQTNSLLLSNLNQITQRSSTVGHNFANNSTNMNFGNPMGSQLQKKQDWSSNASGVLSPGVYNSSDNNPYSSACSNLTNPSSNYSTSTSNIISPNANFNNKWTSNKNPQTNVKQDWSAFESLLPNQNQNTNSDDSNKKSTEMMDLLS